MEKSQFYTRNMQIISTNRPTVFSSICFFFFPPKWIFKKKTKPTPKSSKALLLHLGIEIFYTAAPKKICFHHEVSAGRYGAHWQSCNPRATLGTSLPQSARHERHPQAVTSSTALPTRGSNHSTQEPGKSHFLSYESEYSI